MCLRECEILSHVDQCLARPLHRPLKQQTRETQQPHSLTWVSLLVASTFCRVAHLQPIGTHTGNTVCGRGT